MSQKLVVQTSLDGLFVIFNVGLKLMKLVSRSEAIFSYIRTNYIWLERGAIFNVTSFCDIMNSESIVKGP